MHNTINISSQNLTLAQARNSLEGNNSGYFQIVSFYVASESGKRPNATGLTIQFDPRLTVLGADEGYVFNSKVYNSDGRPVTSRGRGASDQEIVDRENNIFFATTASGDEFTEDGYLYFAMVQFPPETAVGDHFAINVLLEDESTPPVPYEFLFCDASDTAADQTADMTWTKANGIINGGFTIIE